MGASWLWNRSTVPIWSSASGIAVFKAATWAL